MLEHNIISYLQAENFSERPAWRGMVLSDCNGDMTGRAFYAAAASFAARLYGMGIWNRPVAVKAEHRLETLILYLGVLLSGNYYIPLAEDMAVGQVQEILEKTGADGVYTYADISRTEKMPEPGVMERLREKRRMLPENAALYIIFTSGSTGKPKGIVKSHKSMVAFLESFCREFSFSENDVIANQTPFCFDASAKDFYLMLKYRMDFHIIDAGMFFRPMELVRYLNQKRVTVLQWVPSALSILSQLKAFEKEKPDYLKKVFFVGETFQVGQLRYWMEYLPDTVFVNLYGASEMAGVCAFFRIPDNWEGDSIPIGKALLGQKIYLVSEGKEITKPGEIGEICLESEALADGYFSLEQDTKEKFVSSLTDEIAGKRYYHTGDLAKYDDTGNLYFVSRRDFQIKHMGHRIELGEIEKTAEGLDGVDKVGVVYKCGKICLYYQGDAGRQALQKHLKEKLPSYKMPNKIYCLEKLPLNRNGKLDRAALGRIPL